MLRRALLVLLSAGLLYFGGAWVRRALASDERKVAWLVEEIVAGFNETRLKPVLSAFSPAYVDEGSGTTRDRVKDVLLHLFWREMDPETKRFRYRMEVPEESLVISIVPGDPARATLAMRAVFHRTVRGAWELYWDARVRAELADGPEGWKIVRTFDVNHEERAGR